MVWMIADVLERPLDAVEDVHDQCQNPIVSCDQTGNKLSRTKEEGKQNEKETNAREKKDCITKPMEQNQDLKG